MFSLLGESGALKAHTWARRGVTQGICLCVCACHPDFFPSVFSLPPQGMEGLPYVRTFVVR